MKWRWLIGHYIDPALKLSRKQKYEASRRALRMPGSRKRIAMAAVLCGLIATGPLLGGIGALLLLAKALEHATPAQAPSLLLLEDILIQGLVILCPLVLLLVPFWALLLVGWAIRPGVKAALRTMGYEICAKCGYWLRELPDDERRCPECGAERQPMARSDE
ncbi:MAG: hypothetical protein SYC29_10625 [Planctomycetota bacterium]|nr:hypothetical protein [Planctomycetota bacterium]